MTICIAGKNRIAVEAAQFIIEQYPHIKIVASANATDDGVNGWQPSLKYFCAKNDIPLLELTELYEIEDLLLLSLEFDKIISPHKFKSNRLFNIHFSKLPAYKGMFTSVMPLLNGETQSGVTLHYIDKGIDTGAIVDQIVFDLEITITARELYDLYLNNAFELLKRNISSLINSSCTAHPQPHLGSTYYSKAAISFGNVVIDLKKTAFEIHNQIRAFTFRDYQLPKVEGHLIYKSEIIPSPATGKAGSLADENEWYLLINSIDYQVKLYKDKQEQLVKAAEEGDVEVYQTLKTNGYPVKVRTKQGWDALIIACYNNQVDFLKMLLADGWDINTRNYKGTTAAMYAMTKAGKINDLTILLEVAKHNPDWQLKDDAGKNIFKYAEQYGNQQVINYLIPYNK